MHTQTEKISTSLRLTLHVLVVALHLCSHDRVEWQNPERLACNKNFVIGTTGFEQPEAQWRQTSSEQPLFVELKSSQTIYTWFQQVDNIICYQKLAEIFLCHVMADWLVLR